MKTKTIEVVSSDDGTVTVEATSPDEALEAIHQALGGDAKILSAQRESRGGVGGFFATETFVVRASGSIKPEVVPESAPDPATEQGNDEGLAGLGELLARVEKGSEHGSVSFREVLQKELGERELTPEKSSPVSGDNPVVDLRDSAPSIEERQAAIVEARRRRAARTQRMALLRERQLGEDVKAVETPTAPLEIVNSPAVNPVEFSSVDFAPAAESVQVEPLTDPSATVAQPQQSDPSWLPEPSKISPRSGLASRIGHPAGAAPGAGRVVWSLDALAYLGLPFSILQDLVGLDPDDDMAWIESLASQMAKYCRPLPMKESVFVGPRSALLAPLLQVPGIAFPDDPPYGGSVCLRMDDDGAHRAWLSRVQGDRALHLVIGGSCWSDLLVKKPVAISYVGEPDLIITALQLCVKYDIGLGYAMTDQGSFRVNPLDVSLQIRALLGRA